MNSLSQLHECFNKVLASGYLNNKLEISNQKVNSLSEIFTQAIERIEQSVAGHVKQEDLEQDIQVLNELKADGDTLYKTRYCHRSKVRKRKILKFLSACLPPIFRNCLPFFLRTNEIRKREEATENAINLYKQRIDQHVEGMKSQIDFLQTLDQLNRLASDLNQGQGQQFFNAEQGQAYLNLVKKIEKHALYQNQMIPVLRFNSLFFTRWPADLIRDLIPYMKGFNALDISETELTETDINEFKQKGWLNDSILINVSHCPYLKKLAAKQEEIRDTREHLARSLKTILSQDSYFSATKLYQLIKACIEDIEMLPASVTVEVLEECGLEPEQIDCLHTNRDALKIALEQKNLLQLQKLLAIPASKIEAIHSSLIELPLMRLQGQPYLKGLDGLKHSNKAIKIQSEGLELLASFMKQQTGCRPVRLEIEFKQPGDLKESIIQALFHLKALDLALIISLIGLDYISFEKLNLPNEAASKWIEFLLELDCPNLQRINLNSKVPLALTPKQGTALLDLCPTQDMLKQCWICCTTPHFIQIPRTILCQSKVDLSECPLEYIIALLPQFTAVRELNLGLTTIDDETLAGLIQQGLLKELKRLDLRGCKCLTSDIIYSLTELNQLIQLYLPQELKEGEISLDQLPVFDNPFKVCQYYLGPSIFQHRIQNYYKGPSNWASVFQIPLARMKGKKVFPASHHTLDPYSVDYWLYYRDYTQLKQETAIKTIIADNSFCLNDKNLIDFISRFPNLKTLSLYRCSHLTDRGILDLMAYMKEVKLPLQSLDLTGCDQLSQETLDQVKKEFLGKNLIYESTTLRINNSDLKDLDSLNQLLKTVSLNKLVKLDFKGCTDLTDAMLSHVLDRCSLASEEKLNITELNLVGCSQITGLAFSGKTSSKEDFATKFLGSLTYVAIWGTQINEKDVQFLQKAYPTLIFTHKEEEFYDEMNPTARIEACKPADEQKKQMSLLPLMQARIFLSLFSQSIPTHKQQDWELIQQLSFEPNQCKNRKLDFIQEIPNQLQEISFNIPAHQEVLYSQSSGFRKLFRPGGDLFKLDFTDIQNQHTSPKACQALIDLIYGKKDVISQLDWMAASELGELVKPDYFDLPEYMHAIREQIIKFFDMKKASEMIGRAQQLNDRILINTYLAMLNQFLDADGVDEYSATTLAQEIGVIANENGWQDLADKASRFQAKYGINE